MDSSFPSSTEPLLTPATSSESRTTADDQQQQKPQSPQHFSIASGKRKRPVPSFTVSPQDSIHHIQFRIGDAGPENYVLQDLLTSQSSPTAIATPPDSTGGDGGQKPEQQQQGHAAAQRMNSASSISVSSACSLSEHISHQCKITPEISEPKQVLVELYDLKLEDERTLAGCWEETARWIKYEEDVEGVDHRWGLPHVSFLSFHALLQLRKCIAKGIVLLDMPDVSDFGALSELIAAAIASEAHELGTHQNERKLAQILQLRHYPVGGRRLSRTSTAASYLAHLLDPSSRTSAQQLQLVPPPQRSVSAAPLAPQPGHPSAVNMRKMLVESLAVAEGGAISRPHGRSFAHSPPTIDEVDELDSTNNSLHKEQRFMKPRNSTPNVKLTYCNNDSSNRATISLREDKPVVAIKSDRKLTVAERARDALQRRSWKLHETAADSQQRQQQQHLNLPHKCSTEINFAAVHGSESKKLPEGTELVHVLVGEIRWMKKARFVMLRLTKAVPLPELGDTFPIRIIFLILGPSLADGSYHELGRSLATLMANKHFKTIAYGARDRCQLIEGLDHFLDGSVVIPPGEIDSTRLISGDELKKALRRRKKEMSKQKVAAAERDTRYLSKMAEQQQKDAAGNGGPSTATMDPTSSSSPNLLQKSNNNANGGYSGQPNGNGRKSPAEKNENGKKECPLFRGLREDIRNRMPFYWSDIRDAANFQCLTSVVFMFFASFVPAISFGGLMGKYTDETMGTIETLFAQCICGVIWGLFSAQPLLIMSATGPVLIFEASLYTFCETLHLDFLAIRFYAGLFILMIAICISALDGARLLVFVTRFTEDIFATLISAIFIAETLHFVWHTFKENPVEDYNFYERIHLNCPRAHNASFPVPTTTPSPTFFASMPFDIEQTGNSTRNLTAELEAFQRLTAALAEFKDPAAAHRLACGEAEPNTALLTAIIVFSTFILAFMLKKLRESFYLGKHLRRAIGDFGVLIAITMVALIVHWCIPDPYLQRLDMPDHINFTNLEKRGHGLLVRPKLGYDEWHGIMVAFIAALLVFILLFVETEITELLLTRKERGCRKGSGMHWDLVLVGLCAFLCSVLGLPWMCAAAVQSLAHCSSLTVMKKTAPGARPEVDRVIEQRITTIGVSLLIGLIAFAGSYLRLPLASLFGVFLYLGVMNLCGVQLVQRVVLFFIPEKYFPDAPYTQEMSIWRMHLYTWIQLICLFLVYTVKYFKKTALAFPFVLMLFIFFRQIILPRVFTQAELKAIDGEEQEEDEEWTDKDYYYDSQIPV